MKKYIVLLICIFTVQISSAQKLDSILIENNNGKTPPLVVLDGVVIPFDSLKNIDPNAIEDIHILKQAIAEKVFCRVGPEVIVITTKKDDYEVTIYDPEFDAFLAKQEPKKSFDREYLKMQNAIYLPQWNAYCRNLTPDDYGYNSEIAYYNSATSSWDTDYKLYMFFRYLVSKKLLPF